MAYIRPHTHRVKVEVGEGTVEFDATLEYWGDGTWEYGCENTLQELFPAAKYIWAEEITDE